MNFRLIFRNFKTRSQSRSRVELAGWRAAQPYCNKTILPFSFYSVALVPIECHRKISYGVKASHPAWDSNPLRHHGSVGAVCELIDSAKRRLTSASISSRVIPSKSL